MKYVSNIFSKKKQFLVIEFLGSIKINSSDERIRYVR